MLQSLFALLTAVFIAILFVAITMAIGSYIDNKEREVYGD